MGTILRAFLLFILSIIFMSFYSLQYLIISHTIGPIDLYPSPAPHFKTFQVFLIYFPKCPHFSTIKICAPNVVLHQFFRKFKSNLLLKHFLFLCRFFHGNPGFNFAIYVYMAYIYMAKFHYIPIYISKCYKGPSHQYAIWPFHESSVWQ
jgi:hypothetical protein